MATAFVTDLMNSIFTPGPTSSLLLATNVSFAALQVTFLGLLIATFSIHFVVLSVLCGALWWGINWFVAELRAHEAAEKERLREEAEARGESSDSDTDAQTVVGVKGGGSASVEVREEVEGLVQRDLGESPLRSKSDVSTEDEWEKVSENEKDK